MARTRTILTAEEVERIRAQAIHAIAPLKPAKNVYEYAWGGKRTEAGRELPVYYLVYFLLADLLKFPHTGQEEKVAWSIPVEFNGKTATVEYRKMGLGVFSTNSPEDETAAAGIVAAVKRGIGASRAYFDHLAAKAVGGRSLNVRNNGPSLFSRYTYLRDLFKEKANSIQGNGLYKIQEEEIELPGDRKVKSFTLDYSAAEEAKWIGVAAIEAFFSWTEHILIHVAILLGRLKTGEDVADLAEAEWSEKVKKAIDLSAEKELKDTYEELLEIRRQVRNYMAHGAFGKNGEAFSFHTATGAVPVNLTGDDGGLSMWIVPSFEESRAIEVMESFIEKLWKGERAPAKLHLDDDGLPVILSYASNSIYARAMASEEDMDEYIRALSRELDDAANMDW